MDRLDRIEKKVKPFLEYFPEYEGMRRIGIVSGIKRRREVKPFAERKGLYIIGPVEKLIYT